MQRIPRLLFVTSNDFDILYLRVEDIPSKGICLRAPKTFIYCNPEFEQEVLDCLYLCDKKYIRIFTPSYSNALLRYYSLAILKNRASSSDFLPQAVLIVMDNRRRQCFLLLFLAERVFERMILLYTDILFLKIPSG